MAKHAIKKQKSKPKKKYIKKYIELYTACDGFFETSNV